MIILDIGAGSTDFAKKMRHLNPQIQTAFCADPHAWEQKFYDLSYDRSGGLLGKIHGAIHTISTILESEPIEREAICEVMDKKKRGVYKILGTYEDTGDMPDESMDIITINSPHPLTPPRAGLGTNIARILKPGGLFYYSHTDVRYMEQDISELQEFRKMKRFSHHDDYEIIEYQDTEIQIPKSPTVYGNMKAKYWNQPVAPIFHGEINPGSKIWKKE